MGLLRFIIKRYWAYTLLVTCSITLLACLVDFFEKIRHASALEVKVIIELLGIPCATRIFGIFPAGMFLGTLLLHRELKEKHFYETFALIGGSRKKLFLLFFTASTLLAITVVSVREFIVSTLNETTLLSNKAVIPLIIAPLNSNNLGIFTSYNLATNTAKSATLLTLKNNNRLEKEERSINARFNPQEKKMAFEKNTIAAPFLNTALEQARCYRQLYSLHQLSSHFFSESESNDQKVFYRIQLGLWIKFLIDAMILPATSLTLASGIAFSPIAEFVALTAPFVVGFILNNGLPIIISAASKIS